MNRFFKNLLEKLNNDPMFSNTLESEFSRTVRRIKEKNSKIVWDAYYIPKAVEEILRKKNNITHLDDKKIILLAQSMMFRDLAEGTLNEFYKFEK